MRRDGKQKMSSHLPPRALKRVWGRTGGGRSCDSTSPLPGPPRRGEGEEWLRPCRPARAPLDAEVECMTASSLCQRIAYRTSGRSAMVLCRSDGGRMRFFAT